MSGVHLRIENPHVSAEEVAVVVVALLADEEAASTVRQAAPAWQRAAMIEHVGGAQLSSPRDLPMR